MKSLIVTLVLFGLTRGNSTTIDGGLNFVPLSNDLIVYVNSLNSSWKAGINFDGASTTYLNKLCGTLKEPLNSIRSKSHSNNEPDQPDSVDLPTHFDSRETWSDCHSIGTIRDQSACGSCWAVATVSSMSDRLCIKSNGTINVPLSSDEVISCCGSSCGFACEGGYTHEAFLYWINFGIVTGGSYQGDGCLPYSMPPCEHFVNGSRPSCDQLGPYETPYCMQKCVLGYEKDFTSDKYFGERYYRLHSPEAIMSDIMRNGPVTAEMHVYTDFYSYKSGVYQHTIGDDRGHHAVKLIGWGSDQGLDYWMVANSWNTDWGDEGFFKIRRGVNECEIETTIYAALPKL